jgi:hypothetical protein
MKNSARLGRFAPRECEGVYSPLFEIGSENVIERLWQPNLVMPGLVPGIHVLCCTT